jgi:hypothetical protein
VSTNGLAERDPNRRYTSSTLVGEEKVFKRKKKKKEEGWNHP